MVRLLPSLSSLRSFVAVARQLSFSKAAEELHVTPGAVSQQVRSKARCGLRNGRPVQVGGACDAGSHRWRQRRAWRVVLAERDVAAGRLVALQDRAASEGWPIS